MQIYGFLSDFLAAMVADLGKVSNFKHPFACHGGQVMNEKQ